MLAPCGNAVWSFCSLLNLSMPRYLSSAYVIRPLLSSEWPEAVALTPALTFAFPFFPPHSLAKWWPPTQPCNTILFPAQFFRELSSFFDGSFDFFFFEGLQILFPLTAEILMKHSSRIMLLSVFPLRGFPFIFPPHIGPIPFLAAARRPAFRARAGFTGKKLTPFPPLVGEEVPPISPLFLRGQRNPFSTEHLSSPSFRAYVYSARFPFGRFFPKA